MAESVPRPIVQAIENDLRAAERAVAAAKECLDSLHKCLEKDLVPWLEDQGHPVPQSGGPKPDPD